MLENIGFEEDGVTPNYDDDSITPNTRVSYPIHHIQGAVASGQGGHPTDIFFLTCDAFGVLPPLAKLNKGQAMYHFLSGYTAKVAGTEAGVVEPQTTFSAGFGAPFLPLHPTEYARMLGRPHGRPWRPSLVGQHGLDWRRLRRGNTHEAQAHPGHDFGGIGREVGRRFHGGASRVWLERARLVRRRA